MSRYVGSSAPALLTSLEGVFGCHYRHPCIACGVPMVVPDPETPGAPAVLEEGQIWACPNGHLHEYYVTYKDGGRYGTVKLLEGVDRRESGEPTVGEFVPKAG